jgi:uncharacterized protein
MFDPSLAATGFVVGILVGLTGVGGGALMTPILILLFGVRPTLAVGTDLAYASVTKLVGAIQYLRRGQVNFPYVRWLVVGSVPATIATIWVVSPWMADAGIDLEQVTTRALGAMLVVVACLTLTEPLVYGGRLRNSRFIRSHAVKTRFKEPILVVGGIVIGAGVGLTSVGSGSLLMAILLLVSELDILVLIGTDIVHAMILIAAAGTAHWVRGNVEFRLVATLLVGSVPGAWVGSHLSPYVPRSILRMGLALVLGATGLKLVM